MRVLLFCLAVLATTWIADPTTLVAVDRSPSSNNSKWFAQRAANRKGREAMYAGAAADRIDRAKKAFGVFEDIIELAKKTRVAGQTQQLNDMVEFIERLDPEQGKAAAALVKTLPPEPKEQDEKLQKKWESTSKSKRRLFTKPTEVLGEKALIVGITDIAFDCMQQVLRLEPDHPSVRKALNQTKVDDRYYGPKDMVFVKAGLRWDKKLGWIVAKDAERYTKGEYFDIQSKKWTTLKEANAMRSKLEDQWVIQTEHLEIRGTAKLEQLVDVANHLEKFYEQIFASYSAFFSNGKADVRIIFGALDHPRLVVNIAKDPEAYKVSLPKGVDAGWSAGMWVPGAGASYFYAGPMGVMYHEFTHQILHVFSEGCRAEVWVVEGVAVYTQAPIYVDDELTLGDISKNGHIRSHFKSATKGDQMKLDQLLSLNHQSWGASKDPTAQYGAAGALAQFCMEADERKYRSDYVEFVRDSYLGATQGHALWDYLGMTKDEFVSNYEAWEKAAAGGGGSKRK